MPFGMLLDEPQLVIDTATNVMMVINCQRCNEDATLCLQHAIPLVNQNSFLCAELKCKKKK